MELHLSKPEFLTLTTPDGETSVKVDIFEARRMLEKAQQQPTQSGRVRFIIDYLAEKLSLSNSDLAENMALEFTECINRCIIKSLDDRKKKLEAIVSLPVTIQESPVISSSGQ